MTASPTDPIDDLEHGHAELSALLLDVRATVSRIQGGELDRTDGASELLDSAKALEDAMAIHFSREAEALFPFVERRVPALLKRAEALGAEHDAICKRADALSRACAKARQETSSLDAVSAELAGLEGLYSGHAAAELAFLADLRGALDAGGREELRLLLLGL